MTPAEAYITEKHLQQDYEDFLEKRYPKRKRSKEEQQKKYKESLARFVELGRRKPKAKK